MHYIFSTYRCQDGWFKGTSNRTQKCGVFPGNYVTLARGVPNQLGNTGKDSIGESKLTTNFNRNVKAVVVPGRSASNPPELPPRSSSPANTISCSWHGQQDNVSSPLGRSSSAIITGTNTQQLTLPSSSTTKSSDKVGFLYNKENVHSVS